MNGCEFLTTTTSSKNYHHFFPKAVLHKAGYERRQINHIANITIVDNFLNKRKIKTRWPSDYMKEFAKHNDNLDDTMKTHLIDLSEGVWNDDHDGFFEARCEAISKKLAAIIEHRPIDDAGPAVTDDDVDPDAEQDEQEELELEAAEAE